MSHPVDPELFQGLIPCGSQDFPFVDRYAQFAVVFEEQRALGPGTLQVRSMRFTPRLCEEALRCWAVVDGGYVAVQRMSVTWLPWLVEERGSVELTPDTRLEITGRHLYAGARTFVSQFDVRVRSASDSAATAAGSHEARLAWLGRLSVDRRHEGLSAGGRYGHPVLGPRESVVEASGAAAVEGGLVCADPGDPLPEALIRIEAYEPGASDEPGSYVGLTRARALDRPAWDPRSVPTPHLTPAFYEFSRPVDASTQAFSVRFVTRFCATTADDRRRDFDDPTVAVPDAAQLEAGSFDALVESAREDFARRVGRPQAPAPIMPHLAGRLRRARTALLRTGYRATGGAGQYGHLVASTCVPSGSVFTRNFFWDGLFTSVALADFEPELARGAIRTVFTRQTPEGYSPEHTFNYDIAGRDAVGRPQAPIASWAVAHYLRRHPDETDFLREIYPVLVRNHSYWENLADVDRDGLSEWTWSGQTADNSALYDEYNDRMSWLPPIASVQLNSFLYRDARLLGSLAERAGDADAGRYAERAERIAEAMRRVCYVAAERRYRDYNHATQRHTSARTFYLFWPLWAGLPMEREVVGDLIENVLLDPAQFNSSIPFPSAAYDEPTYDPAGYWRGKSWPQITYWLLETLWRHGYHSEADEIARRVVAVYSDQYGYPENLVTDPRVADKSGFPDYNWGVAAFYLVAAGAYRDPLPV